MLKECIAEEFAKTKQMEELFDAEQPELDLLSSEFSEWSKELYILTATKEIERWEDDYCLPHDTSLTIEQRRMRVFAKKSEKVITKKDYIRDKIRTMLDATQVSIEEKDCCLIISYETAYLVDNLEICKDYLKKIRPAHWGYQLRNEINRSNSSEIYWGISSETIKQYEWEVKF